jgi:peptidyl-prolyl cis-trans isomerase C
VRKSFYLFALLAAIPLGLGAGCSSKPGDKDKDKASEQEAKPDAPQPAAVEEPANPAKFPDVVAKVNATDIEKAELLEQVSSVENQARGAIDTTTITFYRRVLDDMVGAELLYQSSVEKHLAAASGDVEKQLDTFRSRFPTPQAFDQALAAQGMTLDGLKKQIQRDMSIQKLIETDITPKITVTEEAKRKFYDENSDKMRQADRLRLSHILKRVAPDATPETKAAARREMDALLEQAKGGADFGALAREHSDDPGSAKTGAGGELVVGRGETVPSFEEAAFALQPGGLSPVVETQFGFHIIKLLEKIDGQLVPYDQVSPKIEEYLKQQGLQEQIQSTVEALKGKAQVEIFIG